MFHSPIRFSNEKSKEYIWVKDMRIILKTKLSNGFRHYQRSKKKSMLVSTIASIRFKYVLFNSFFHYNF